MKQSRKRILYLLTIVIGIIIADAVSKAMVYRFIPNIRFASSFFPYGGIAVFKDWLGIDLSLVHVTNRGSAWGMFSSHHLFLLIVRSLVTFIMILHLVFFNEIKARDIPLALIIAGAMGNIFDCFLYNHVIDMIYFIFWGYSFPVFNLADMSISIGVFLILLHALYSKITFKEKLPSSNQSINS